MAAVPVIQELNITYWAYLLHVIYGEHTFFLGHKNATFVMGLHTSTEKLLLLTVVLLKQYGHYSHCDCYKNIYSMFTLLVNNR